MAGVFFPSPEGNLPADLKRELFEKLSAEIVRWLKARGTSEKEVQSDLESWRKARRDTRCMACPPRGSSNCASESSAKRVSLRSR